MSDIAEVRDGIAEVRSISRLNGRPATTFAVYKAKGASDVETLQRIEDELGKIGKETPSDHAQAGLHDGRFHASTPTIPRSRR